MKVIDQTTLEKYWKLSFGLATLVLLCLGTAVAQTSYTVTDLGTLGGTFSVGVGISDRSWVNGFSTLQGDQQVRATLWVQGLKIDLGTLGGPNSFSGFPLNDRGEVTGGAEPPSTPDPNGEDFCGFGDHLICLPFLWKDGVMTALPTLGGNNGLAFEINNRGQVAGLAENNRLDPTCVAPQVALQPEAVVWQNGKIQELPTFPGDPDGQALAINDNGQVVGASGNCTNGASAHLLLWQNGTPTDLGGFGGAMNNLATDINNLGQVIGKSDLPGDLTNHAFLWQNGVMTDLGTLPGDFSSEASGINENGQVVGGSQDASGNGRAFLWQDGVMTDLNTLISAGSPLFLLFATAINSRGEIAGLSLEKSTGEVHAFLATPNSGEVSSESTTPAARGEGSERPKVTLPENVGKMLRQRLGFGRFGAGPMRPQ